MVTLKDAAQQALEALEIYFDAYPHMQKGYVMDAIVDLRAALAEQPAEQEPDDIGVQQDKRVFARIEAMKKRTAPQPKATQQGYREGVEACIKRLEELHEDVQHYHNFYRVAALYLRELKEKTV